MSYFSSPPILPRTTTSGLIAVTGGPLTLFTITTGVVKIVSLFGRVTTTAIGAGATQLQLQIDATAAGTNTLLCGISANIANAAVGSMVGISGNFADAMLTSPTTVGAIYYGSVPFNLDPGVLQLVITGGTTGTIQWTVEWSPVSTGATLA